VVGLCLGWATVGAPLTWLAIRSGRKAPDRAKVRAIPWSIAIAGWTGLVVGLVGFVWGAGVGDESAGEIAGVMFSIGCLSGAPVGGIAAWVFITRKVRRPGAAGPASAS
jgi:hypothetical protein